VARQHFLNIIPDPPLNQGKGPGNVVEDIFDFAEGHSHFGVESKVTPVVAFVVWYKLCRPC